MRLRLSIERHELPVVKILFHVGNEATTISQLLEQISDVVPLEADGWGHEDYTVQVNGYECLHYQTVRDILHEEDEVSVRALETSDIRARAVSGRLQISAAGAHLIDGIPFGRNYLKRPDRPPFHIPPRKRQRISYDHANSGNSSGNFQHEHQLRITSTFDNADVEEEVTGERQAIEEAPEAINEPLPETGILRSGKRRKSVSFDESSLSSAGAGPQFNIFEDNGVGEDEDDFVPSGSEPTSEATSETDSDDESPEEILDVHRQANVPAVLQEHAIVSGSGDSDDEGGASDSSSVVSTISSVVSTMSSSSVSSNSSEDPAHHQHDESTSDPDRSSLDDDSSSSDSNSSVSDDSDAREETPSSSDTSSESDEEESTFVSGNFTSVNDSSSAIRPTDNSQHQTYATFETPSDSSATRKIKQSAPGKGNIRTRLRNQRRSREKKARMAQQKGLQEGGETFGNELQERKQQLMDDALARDGLDVRQASLELPVPLNETGVSETRTSSDTLTTDQPSRSLTNLPDQSNDIMQDLDGVQDGGVNDAHEECTNRAPVALMKTSAPSFTKRLRTTMLDFLNSATNKDIDEPESKRQRSKLDLNSSRRLVFGSLGVRTPNNKEEAERVRALLGKQVDRKPRNAAKDVPAGVATEFGEGPTNPEAWKSKIKLSAVECLDPDVKYSAPPFPFVQRWDPQQQYDTAPRGRKRKRNNRNYGDFEDERGVEHPDLQYDVEDNIYANDARYVKYGNWNEASRVLDGSLEPTSQLLQEIAESSERAQSEETSGNHRGSALQDKNHIEDEDGALPVPPADIEGLAVFTFSDAHPGMIITFKQLEFSEKTRWEPVVSVYRTAIIDSVLQKNRMLMVTLAKRDRNQPPEIKYDRDGNRIYGKFEVDMGSDGEDDGKREFYITDLIAPKIVPLSHESAQSFLPGLSSLKEAIHDDSNHKESQVSETLVVQDSIMIEPDQDCATNEPEDDDDEEEEQDVEPYEVFLERAPVEAWQSDPGSESVVIESFTAEAAENDDIHLVSGGSEVEADSEENYEEDPASDRSVVEADETVVRYADESELDLYAEGSETEVVNAPESEGRFEADDLEAGDTDDSDSDSEVSVIEISSDSESGGSVIIAVKREARDTDQSEAEEDDGSGQQDSMFTNENISATAEVDLQRDPFHLLSETRNR